MQILTVITEVRFRAAQGEGMFYDPFNECFVDNSVHAGKDELTGKDRGSWVTFKPGVELCLVAAYDKGQTYCLVVNDQGDGLKSESSYGLIVRDGSMEKILQSVAVGVTEVEEVEEVEEVKLEAAVG